VTPARRLPLPPLLACALVTACTYERDPDLSPDGESATFRVVRTAPGAGAIDASRVGPIDVFFNRPPDGLTVVRSHLRVYTGLYEVDGTLHADLLERRVRFTPDEPMRANLRHRVFVHEDLGGTNGVSLGSRFVFDFTTGSTDRTPAGPRPEVTTAQVLQVWRASGCARSGCHRGGAPPLGVELSTASAVRRTLVNIQGSHGGPLVKPGDHARSYLMLKLLGEGGIYGFAMPPGDARLSRQQLRKVADWIDGGAGE
jgi:hypothetical protein